MLLLAACPAGHAQTADTAVPEQRALRLNGFGTLGLVHVDRPAGWGFRRDASQPSVSSSDVDATVDSRLGLQANYRLSNQFELVAQGVLRRRVDSSARSALEWAFVAWRPTPVWTLRAGRINPDVYLLSDYRNVGFAYPWARPEIGFYGSISVYTLTGADITRHWNRGDATWKFKAFAGNGSLLIAGDTNAKLQPMYGASLTREAHGLTLRASAAGMRVTLDSPRGEQLDGALAGLEQIPDASVQQDARSIRSQLGLGRSTVSFVELGASYEGDRWLWSTEVAALGGGIAAARKWHAYASLGRRFGAFTPFGMLATSHSRNATQATPDWQQRLSPMIGSAAAAQAQMLGSAGAAAINSQRQSQSSLSLGVRWDFTPRTALKLQWDHYLVHRHGGVMFNAGTANGGRVNVATVLVDFLF